MSWSVPEPGAASRARPAWRVSDGFLFLVASSLLVAGLAWGLRRHWGLLIAWRPAGIRLVFDAYDIVHSYLPSSGWVASGGMPCVDSFSEYPLLANLLFGFCRLLAEIWPVLPTPASNMVWWWMALSLFSFAWVLRWAVRSAFRGAVVLLLLPASLFFTLYRYDFYPAALTLLGLVFCSRARWLAASLSFGAVIALKGYLLFGVPAFAVFLAARMPWRRALFHVGIVLAPFVVGNLMVGIMGDWKNVAWPYAFHARRPPNGESTFDALAYLAGWSLGGTSGRRLLGEVVGVRWLWHVVQLGGAVLAAAFRPSTVAELAKAFLFSILMFWNFEVFSSPQFVLWLIPLLCFVGPGRIFWAGAIVITIDYVCFPVLYDSRAALGTDLWFRLGIVAFTASRFALMVLAAQRWSRPLWGGLAGRTGDPPSRLARAHGLA